VTYRERAILDLIKAGESKKDIARIVGVSVEEVERVITDVWS